MTTATEVEINCNKIRKLLKDGRYNGHRDIYTTLGMPKRTYYDYLERIQKQDKEEVEHLAKESFLTRTNRIRKALEFVSKTSYQIINDENQPSRNRVGACDTFLRAEYWLFRLDEVGPNLPQQATNLLKSHT